ncbi:hypothetical protein D3C81_2131250 [compost metagenome]
MTPTVSTSPGPQFPLAPEWTLALVNYRRTLRRGSPDPPRIWQSLHETKVTLGVVGPNASLGDQALTMLESLSPLLFDEL